MNPPAERWLQPAGLGLAPAKPLREMDQQKEAEEAEDKSATETSGSLTRCEEIGFGLRFKRLNLCCLRFLLFKIVSAFRQKLALPLDPTTP
jgi:hypothetical protein